MWQIYTYTKRHFISTTWIEALSVYETMIFEYKNSKVDWAEKAVVRTKDRKRATVNHCDTIKLALAWEGSHAKNA